MTIILDEWCDANGRWVKYVGPSPFPTTTSSGFIFESPSNTAA